MLKQGVTNLVQFQSSSLSTNSRMYLYDTPRDTMAKDPMFQRLCSTSTWKAPRLMPNTSNYLFMCSRDSLSTQMSQNSCSPELLAEQKKSIYPCAPELLTQHKLS